MKCMSWSSRSASTRTVEEPLLRGGRLAGRLGAATVGLPRRLRATSPVSTAASLTASVTSTWSTSDTAPTDGGQLGVGALGDHPGVDLAAVEGVDVVRRRRAGERLAELGERRQHHVGAHGRDLDVVGQRRADLDDAAAVGHLGEVDGRLDGLASAASSSASRSRTRPLRRSISGSGSISSSPVSSIASTAADSASRHSSSTSIASRGRPPLRWRSSSKTSSISCVSAAMPAKPIVALMPFSECAIRKISSTVSWSSGRSSMRTTARLSSWRCSRPSARNIGRYSEISMLASSSGR